METLPHFCSCIRYYIPSLKAHQKWHAIPGDLKRDMVDMLVDPQLPRTLWPIGRVTKVHPITDGYARSAEVKIKD
jgi:hypothetical protein